jgi:cyclopropane fatty-acyl-phospholipid synthase-like methyltransferase
MKFIKGYKGKQCHDMYMLRGYDFYKNMLDSNNEKYSKYKYKIKSIDDYECLLCGKTKGEVVLTWKEKYQLISCDNCHAVTANIDCSLEQEYVSELYNEAQFEIVKKSMLSTYQYRKKTFGKERYEYCIKRLKLNEDKISVLDIGCGVGYFLSVLKEKNIHSMGLEVDAFQVDFCKSNGLNVTDSDVSNLDEKKFDLIVMFDVLEHLTNPTEMFRSLSSKLKDGGRIVAYTPFIHSFGFELMSERQNLLYPFQHVCFYNEASLNYLSRSTGLKVESIDYYGLDVADYLLYKEYEDGYPYMKKLHDLACLMQSVLDKAEISNHLRVTFYKDS